MSECTTLDPIHPGEIVREEIKERGLSDKELWLFMGREGYFRLIKIMAGKTAIDEQISDRLSELLGTSKEFFLNLQERFDESLGKYLSEGVK